jgi:hypothetical protein
MTKPCKYCNEELNEEETFCLSCGKSVDITFSKVDTLQLIKREKRLATLSIIFGVIGIYPLIGVGGLIGILIAKKGFKIEHNHYLKQLKVGYWISLLGFVFWSLALLVFLIQIGLIIFKDIWEMITDFIKLFY